MIRPLCYPLTLDTRIANCDIVTPKIQTDGKTFSQDAHEGHDHGFNTYLYNMHLYTIYIYIA
jgi:hypothetical protein